MRWFLRIAGSHTTLGLTGSVMTGAPYYFSKINANCRTSNPQLAFMHINKPIEKSCLVSQQ